MIKGLYNKSGGKLYQKKHIPNQENLIKSPGKMDSNKMIIERPITKQLPYNKKGIDENVVSKLMEQITIKPQKHKKTHSLAFGPQIIQHSKPEININTKENVINTKILEPIEIELGPTVDLDVLYEVDYGKVMEENIFKNQLA
jgi:hypothetical protein